MLILLFKVFRTFYGLDASSLRRYSIALHAVVTIMLHHLAIHVTKHEHIAMGAAMLFAAHPVHVEAVAAVVNIAEACSCIFYITAYFIFDHVRNSVNILNLSLLHLVVIPIGWVLSVFAGILFKESALSICGIIIGKLIIESIHRYGATKRLVHSIFNWRNIQWSFMSILIAILYGLLRNILINGFNSKNVDLSSAYLSDSQLIRNAENPFAFLHGKEKAMSLMYLHFRYFWVMLWPDEQSAEYSFNCIPKVSTSKDPRFVTTCIFYGLLLGAGLYGIVRLASATTVQGNPKTKTSTSEVTSGTAPPESLEHDIASEDTDYFSYSPTALLDSLMWMIIPFIPAAGVFLRLGTLLAERLLYIPSLGFCLLLSLAVFHTTNMVTLWQSKRISAAWYWITILIITIQYALKAREYSPHWHNDATLFRKSLVTCPNSAKLQLQVAKLHLNAGQHDKARVHIARAKEIDPNFCDIGYQEALLALVGDGDSVRAMELAADNLQCIYSSKGALELLQKIWEQQLEMAPKSTAVLTLHGDIAMRGGLPVIAARKYQQSVNIAVENRNLPNAVEISRKAIHAVANISATVLRDSPELATTTYYELMCWVHSVGGVIRYQLREQVRQEFGTANAGDLELGESSDDDDDVDNIKLQDKKFEQKQPQLSSDKDKSTSTSTRKSTSSVVYESKQGKKIKVKVKVKSKVKNPKKVAAFNDSELSEATKSAPLASKEPQAERKSKGKRNRKDPEEQLLASAAAALKWDKKFVKEISLKRVRQLLEQTLRPECIMKDPSTGNLGINYATVGMNTMADILSKSFNANDVSSVEEYARFMETVIRITYYSYESVFQEWSKHGEISNSIAHLEKIFPVESIANMVQLWTLSARYHYEQGSHVVAMEKIDHALQLDDESIDSKHSCFHDRPEVLPLVRKLWQDVKKQSSNPNIATVQASKSATLKL